MQLSHQEAFSIELHFYGDLRFFLRRRSEDSTLIRILREKTSAKDAIEACGVPHPEIDLIRCNGVIVPLEHQLKEKAILQVYGVADSHADVESALQKRGLTRFIADGHLGKLARDLRFLGFDVLYSPTAKDAELVTLSKEQNRALLTRDRRLLMHRVVQHGYCPRSHDPDKQIIETVRRFELNELITPFTRCIHCNGILVKVDKQEVFDELEPLTRIYYRDFRRCLSCRRIYWAGSHFEKLQARLASIRDRLR